MAGIAAPAGDAGDGRLCGRSCGRCGRWPALRAIVRAMRAQGLPLFGLDLPGDAGNVRAMASTGSACSACSCGRYAGVRAIAGDVYVG